MRVMYNNPKRWSPEEPRTIPYDPDRCGARLSGYYRGEQCSRKRPVGEKYCTQHRNKLRDSFPLEASAVVLMLVGVVMIGCTSPTSPFVDCPVEVVVAPPGATVPLDSLRNHTHPDSLAVLPGDSVAVVARC